MGKLAVRMVEKPWGKQALPAPFAAPEGQRIGEVWFVPPAELPGLLIKYIFTSEALSVQVHPDDAQAAASGETARTGWGGKEECWLVIDAEPGATLGVGFAAHHDAAALRAAALDGSIEDMLVWHPVQAGDFFYIPAGTVHAIGAGVSLIEIQQNSDITYRLYDYGRPRELHLEAGLQVARGEPLDPALHRMIPAHGTAELARGRHFSAVQVAGTPDAALLAEFAGPLLVIPRQGPVHLADGSVIHPGDCASAPALSALTLPADGQAILVKPAGLCGC